MCPRVAQIPGVTGKEMNVSWQYKKRKHNRRETVGAFFLIGRGCRIGIDARIGRGLQLKRTKVDSQTLILLRILLFYSKFLAVQINSD